MRVRSDSSRVRLPELPDAKMETRKPIGEAPEEQNAKTCKMMAERGNRVNAQK
jgi:hypothetical protein